MRITFEETKNLTLIYIYLRPFDGIIIDTLSDIRVDFLFDAENNWIGIEVFNVSFDDEKVDLPILKDIYVPTKNEVVTLSKDGYLVWFGSNRKVDSRLEVACNIDFNSVNGLQGIEFILEDFTAGLKHIKSFIL